MPFPELPILNSIPPAQPAAPRKQSEKYGGLFYLGICGLLVLLALVGFFIHGVWANRAVWADVYTLHDTRRAEADRIQAAYRLSRDESVSDVQRQQMALERPLPELARYLLAEAVSIEVVARDPRAFALAVARSPDWPDWLRLLWARRLVYGAARQYAIPREAALELSGHADPMIRAWAYAVFAAAAQPDAAMAAELAKAAQDPRPAGQLAARLMAALELPEASRERQLDQVTEWMRHHHPQAAEFWQGWQVKDGRLVQESE
jgi:hypothetical protein